jgi:hypothetical protein
MGEGKVAVGHDVQLAYLVEKVAGMGSEEFLPDPPLVVLAGYRSGGSRSNDTTSGA